MKARRAHVGDFTRAPFCEPRRSPRWRATAVVGRGSGSPGSGSRRVAVEVNAASGAPSSAVGGRRGTVQLTDSRRLLAHRGLRAGGELGPRRNHSRRPRRAGVSTPAPLVLAQLRGPVLRSAAAAGRAASFRLDGGGAAAQPARSRGAGDGDRQALAFRPCRRREKPAPSRLGRRASRQRSRGFRVASETGGQRRGALRETRPRCTRGSGNSRQFATKLFRTKASGSRCLVSVSVRDGNRMRAVQEDESSCSTGLRRDTPGLGQSGSGSWITTLNRPGSPWTSRATCRHKEAHPRGRFAASGPFECVRGVLEAGTRAVLAVRLLAPPPPPPAGGLRSIGRAGGRTERVTRLGPDRLGTPASRGQGRGGAARLAADGSGRPSAQEAEGRSLSRDFIESWRSQGRLSRGILRGGAWRAPTSAANDTLALAARCEALSVGRRWRRCGGRMAESSICGGVLGGGTAGIRSSGAIGDAGCGRVFPVCTVPS